MLYKLTIGYQQFIIDGDAGVTTIMRTMAKARMIEGDKRYRGGEIELRDGPVDVVLEALPNLHYVKRKSGKASGSVVLEPEVLPPCSLPRHEPQALPGGRTRIGRDQLMLGGQS